MLSVAFYTTKVSQGLPHGCRNVSAVVASHRVIPSFVGPSEVDPIRWTADRVN